MIRIKSKQILNRVIFSLIRFSKLLFVEIKLFKIFSAIFNLLTLTNQTIISSAETYYIEMRGTFTRSLFIAL